MSVLQTKLNIVFSAWLKWRVLPWLRFLSWPACLHDLYLQPFGSYRCGGSISQGLTTPYRYTSGSGVGTGSGYHSSYVPFYQRQMEKEQEKNREKEEKERNSMVNSRVSAPPSLPVTLATVTTGSTVSTSSSITVPSPTSSYTNYNSNRK